MNKEDVDIEADETVEEPVLIVDYKKQNEAGYIFVDYNDELDLQLDQIVLIADEDENLVKAKIKSIKDNIIELFPDWETWNSPSQEAVPLASKAVLEPESSLIDIEKIELLDNPRGDVGDVSELAESIRVGGLLHPVVVRRTPEGSPKPFQLVVGYRRFNAHLFLKREKIPAIIHQFSHEDILAHLITENLQRKGWTAISEAQAMQRMIDVLGYSQSKVAKILGIHRSQVSRRLALLNLPETVKDMVSEGDLSASHAEVLMSLKNSDSQEELANLTSKSGASVGKLNSWAQKVRQQEVEEEEAIKWQEDQKEAQQTALETDDEFVEDKEQPSTAVDKPEIEQNGEDKKPVVEINSAIYAEALMSDKDPIQETSSQSLVSSMPALSLSDWDEEDQKKALLYMMLRASNDKEALDYLYDQYEVERDEFWDFIKERSIEDIDDMTNNMLRRWFSAPHRYPTFPNALKEDLGEGEIDVPPKADQPHWELSIEDDVSTDWEDDWGDE